MTQDQLAPHYLVRSAEELRVGDRVESEDGATVATVTATHRNTKIDAVTVAMRLADGTETEEYSLNYVPGAGQSHRLAFKVLLPRPALECPERMGDLRCTLPDDGHDTHVVYSGKPPFDRQRIQWEV